MADYTGSISLSQARGDLSHTSDDEDDDHSPRTTTPLTAISGGGSGPKSITRSSGSGYETSTRKPRGRPPGSKNKPKPPIVVTREIESAMKPAILEIAANSDIIEMVKQFARRHHAGISILSASGAVTNITLRHAGSHAPTLTFHGTFEILSLSGSFMGSSSSTSSSFSSSSFGISLSGAQGQVFGGIVAGKAVAATPVVVVAAVFVSPTYHRLPREFEEGEDRKPIVGGCGGGGGGGASEGCSSSGVSMNVYGVAAPTPLNSQISPTDHHVLPWGPTSRQPPPY